MRKFNDKDPLVSVIVPIYNVKQYIRKGLQVLNKQYFRNFEIILVDDGSTDGSIEICKENRLYWSIVSPKWKNLS